MLARMFPSPGPGAKGVKVFRAPRLWEFNICAALAAGVCGALVILALAGNLIRSTGRVGWVPAFLIVDMVGGLLILLPGNYASRFPYAVEVVEGKGLWFYAPFKKMYVPLEEIKQVGWSYAGAGWAVRLGKRRGVIKTIIIYVAWWRVGRELAAAIEGELARRGI